MRAATSGILVCRTRDTIRCAQSQTVKDLLLHTDKPLVHTNHSHPNIWEFSKFQSRLNRGTQNIVEGFVVNFDVATFHCELGPALNLSVYHIEYLKGTAWDYAKKVLGFLRDDLSTVDKALRDIFWAKHRKRLTGSALSIGKNRTIVAFGE